MTAGIAGVAIAALGLGLAALAGRRTRTQRLTLVLGAITGAFGTGALVAAGLFDTLSLPVMVGALVVYGVAVSVAGRMTHRG